MEDSKKTDKSLLPLRMLVEWVYCPRLFYLMHVEGQMSANAPVWRGRLDHAGVDRSTDRVARRQPSRSKSAGDDGEQREEEDAPLPETWRSITALDLSSQGLGLVGRLDTVLLSKNDTVAVPAERKSGMAPNPEHHLPPSTVQGVWAADAVHVCAQALLLEEAGYRVPHGEIYYSSSRKLLRIELTQALRRQTMQAAASARAVESTDIAPEPLEDSPKCQGCSMLEVCLPEETAMLRSGPARELDDPDAQEAPVRRILPARIEDHSVMAVTPGTTIRKQGEALRIEVPAKKGSKKEVTRVPLDSLAELCVTGRVQLTLPALTACLQRGAPVGFVTGWGRLLGLAVPSFGNNVQLRIAQHEVAREQERALGIARAIVGGKIQNQRVLIRRNQTDGLGALQDDLAHLVKAAADAVDIESLMGVEGRAARIYFKGLSALLERRGGEGFRMTGRSRRPPRDRSNALLSFGYAVLTKDLAGILFRVGFDPFVGFLHAPGWGRPALALDLVEEFRSLVVDSTVLRVVAQRMVGENDFRTEASSVLLSPKVRRVFLRALDARKQTLVTHPVFGYRLSYLRTMELQARLLARLLQGEADEYIPMTTR